MKSALNAETDYNIKNQKIVVRELQVVFQIRGERLFLFLSRGCSRIHWRRKPFQKEASYPMDCGGAEKAAVSIDNILAKFNEISIECGN